MDKAVIFIPAGDDDYKEAAARCMDYATSEGYALEGVVLGDWAAVRQMMMAKQVDVVIVATRDQLPADRSPRIEIVAEETVHRPVRQADERRGPMRRRRPRPLV